MRELRIRAPGDLRWYTSVMALPGLEHILGCLWTATAGGPYDLVPDACIDLVWVMTGEIILCGPETTGWSFELPHGTAATGARFRPGAAPAVLGVSARTWINARTPLRNVLDESTERALRDQLLVAPDLDGQRVVLEQFVADLVGRAPRRCAVDLQLATEN